MHKNADVGDASGFRRMLSVGRGITWYLRIECKGTVASTLTKDRNHTLSLRSVTSPQKKGKVPVFSISTGAVISHLRITPSGLARPPGVSDKYSGEPEPFCVARLLIMSEMRISCEPLPRKAKSTQPGCFAAHL
jgi:hypothetical protein